MQLALSLGCCFYPHQFKAYLAAILKFNDVPLTLSICRRQGNKLRRLMTFAWPCLLAKSCVDPATKYNGHLLLSHIIAKFAIHKRIVLQVFHSLLKAHAVEARTVVRQALDILTPAMPGRMEDGNVSCITVNLVQNSSHVSFRISTRPNCTNSRAC